MIIEVKKELINLSFNSFMILVNMIGVYGIFYDIGVIRKSENIQNYWHLFFPLLTIIVSVGRSSYSMSKSIDKLKEFIQSADELERNSHSPRI